MNGQCEYVFDGNDTDETKWYRCTTHHQLELSQDAPCKGYQEERYPVEDMVEEPVDPPEVIS